MYISTFTGWQPVNWRQNYPALSGAVLANISSKGLVSLRARVLTYNQPHSNGPDYYLSRDEPQ